MSRLRTISIAGTAAVLALTMSPISAPAAHAATTIAHHGSSSAVTTAAADGIAVDLPDGAEPGDVLVARVANRDAVAATMTAPSGWTQVGVHRSLGLLKSWVFTKVVGANEPSSYDFEVSRTSKMVGSISSFAGVDTDQPVDEYVGKVNGTSALLDGAGVSTDTAGEVAVWFASQLYVSRTCPSPVLTPPAGFTEVVDVCPGTLPTGMVGNAGYRQLGSAGSEDDLSSVSPNIQTNIVQTVTLRPAGAVVSPTEPVPPVTDTFAKKATTVGQLWQLDGNGNRSTAIPASQLYEPSGLAASRTNAGVLYAESEKDKQTVVAIQQGDAKVVGSFDVDVPAAYDTEDIAVGPCPSGNCLYLADIGSIRGDKAKPDNTFSVTRVAEPDLAAGKTSGTLAGDTFRFTYPAFAGEPAGENLNAESLIVDPATSAMYVITKDDSGAGLSQVFTFPTPLPKAGSTTELDYVGPLQLPASLLDAPLSKATAASAHPTEPRFLLRTYRRVYEFRGTTAGGLASAFKATPVRLTDTVEAQGEAITYAADASAYYTLGEMATAPYTLKKVAAITR